MSTTLQRAIYTENTATESERDQEEGSGKKPRTTQDVTVTEPLLSRFVTS